MTSDGLVAVTVPWMVEPVTDSPAPGATVIWPSWVALTRQVSPLVTLSGVGLVPVTVVVQAGARSVYSSAAEPSLVLPRVVTVTAMVRARPGGAVTVIEVSEFTVTFAAGMVPNETLDAPVKPVPVIVTGLPPAVGPEFGETPVTVGFG